MVSSTTSLVVMQEEASWRCIKRIGRGFYCGSRGFFASCLLEREEGIVIKMKMMQCLLEMKSIFYSGEKFDVVVLFCVLTLAETFVWLLVSLMLNARVECLVFGGHIFPCGIYVFQLVSLS